MAVMFLVAASLDRGIEDARAQEGWQQIAHTRFVTPGKDDIRVVARAADLGVLPGGTPMIKGSDYEDGPAVGGDGALDAWVRQKDDIDRFVESGGGRWVKAP